MYNDPKGDDYMADKRRQNMTIEPEVFEEFCKYAGPKGIKISTWVNERMKEFIEDEKALAELKKKRKDT